MDGGPEGWDTGLVLRMEEGGMREWMQGERRTAFLSPIACPSRLDDAGRRDTHRPP